MVKKRSWKYTGFQLWDECYENIVYSIGNIVNGIMMCCMVIDDSYSCGEYTITYTATELLCCTPDSNITLFQLYISKNF